MLVGISLKDVSRRILSCGTLGLTTNRLSIWTSVGVSLEDVMRCEPHSYSSSPSNPTAQLLSPANANIIKLNVFKGLNKKEQKSELARVNKKFRKRYATTGNKTNNKLVYKQCLKENKGLEVNALELDTL
jgi:hypothetical protein